MLERDVIGDAVAAKVGENAELAVARWRSGIAAHRPAAAVNRLDRTIFQNGQGFGGEAEEPVGHSFPDLPQRAVGMDLRMQDRHAGREPRYRNAMVKKLLGERGEKGLGLGDPPCVGQEPVDQRIFECEPVSHERR